MSEARKKNAQNEFMFMFGVELRIEFTEINEKEDEEEKNRKHPTEIHIFVCHLSFLHFAF